MPDLIAAVAIIIGTAFLMIASLGMLRLPDFYARIHASTKAATLGLALLLIALAIGLRDRPVITKALLAMAFICATAPVGAHILARAAYATKVPPLPDNAVDVYAGFHPDAADADKVGETAPAVPEPGTSPLRPG